MRNAIGPYPPRFHSSERPARPEGISRARWIGLVVAVTSSTARTAITPAGIHIAVRVIERDGDRCSRQRPMINATAPMIPHANNAVRDPDSHMPAKLMAKTATAAAGAWGPVPACRETRLA